MALWRTVPTWQHNTILKTAIKRTLASMTGEAPTRLLSVSTQAQKYDQRAQGKKKRESSKKEDSWHHHPDASTAAAFASESTLER